MSSSPGEGRLMSLDVFRGATIAAMMLVNNPGDWSAVYAPLRHAAWHGWTFTDLIFPFFLWIVGMAIPLSISKRLEAGANRTQLLSHAIRRACIIFALGLLLNSFGYFVDGSLFRDGFSEWLRHYLTTVRVPGVLQRIAICYLAAIGLYLCGGLRAQITALMVLLLGYWLLMTVVPVPGHGPGMLEKEGNLSQYIDNLVLNGPVIGKHVYKGSKIYDPEGILSTLPAIGTCILGVLAGMLLRTSRTREEKTAWMFTGGAVLLWVGQLWNLCFPINKEIWTSSYTVFMAGMAMTCFACCYWLVDIQGWKKFAQPFAIYGMNAITVFVLSGMIGRLIIEIKVGDTALKTWLFNNTFGTILDPRFASLCWAVAWVLMLYAVAWVMHRRRWFVKF